MKTKLLRGLAAALVSVFAIGAAFALNVDQTRTMSKRIDPAGGYHPTYYRVNINYNDPGISAGQAFGALGQNEFIRVIDCHVKTAFNASTTNVLTFGTTKASANEIVQSGQITASTTTSRQALTSAIGLGVNATSAGDVTLYAKYAQTGTAATAGAMTCVIETVPDNDM
jgi:hypothetical protein